MGATGAREKGSLEDVAAGDGDGEGVRAYCPWVVDEVGLDNPPDTKSWTEGQRVVGGEDVVTVEALPGERDGVLRSRRG